MDYIKVNLSIKLKEDIKFFDLSEKLSQGVNKYFLYNEELKAFHKENKFKFYNVSLLNPIEMDKLYKKDKIYNLEIKFFDKKILNSFYKSLLEIENTIFSLVNRDYEIIKQDTPIREITSITPCVISLKKANPKDRILNLSVYDYKKEIAIEYLNANALRKYNKISGSNIENHYFIEDIEILNRKSFSFNYKRTKIISNKFKIKIKEDKVSQDIAFAVLGTGLGEKNSLCYGFCKINS